MRALIQYVSQASVSAPKHDPATIAYGYLLLVGFSRTDSPNHIKPLVNQILTSRFIPDKNGKINFSLQSSQGDLLVIPQFTLYWDTTKGLRPSFHLAAPPDNAKDLYRYFLHTLSQTYFGTVKAGFFGAHMQVSLINNGPLTILLEN